MADIEKGLPVRTEDDADKKIQSKIVDFTTPSQGAEVDTDKNLHVEVHGNDPTSTDRTMRTSELGHPSIDGEHDGTNNTDPSSIGIVALVRNASPGDTQQTQRLTAKTSGDSTVRALDVSLHDEDGEPFSGTNPMPVTLEESEGTETHDFKGGADVAAGGGTDNHDLVIADGNTFLLKKILAAASSRFRVELRIGDGAVAEVFATKAVKFGSEDTKDADIGLEIPIVVVGTVNGTTIRVIRQNDDDDDAQSVYTTIIGINRP